MNKIFFTTGPSELLPEIKGFYENAIQEKIFSISHRSSDFENIFFSTVQNLRKLLVIPDDFYVFFLSSGTECMERIIENLTAEKSFHIINGYFAERFYKISKQLMRNPESISFDFGKDFGIEEINVSSDAEIICVTQNETSTGMRIPFEIIKKLKVKYPDKNIVLDMVSALPYEKIDFNAVDAVFFSVQKGFGMPPGCGVLIIRSKCINKTKELISKNYYTGSFNNFLRFEESYIKNQTPVTPNIPSIYILGKVCEVFLKKGIDQIREETEKKANILYNFFDKSEFFRPFVENINYRSKTTLVIESEICDKVIEKLDFNNIRVSRGYGKFRDNQFRIANFPVHKFEWVQDLIYNLRKF